VETCNVILQGGGEHARVVLDCLLSQGVPVVGLFDPRYHDHLFGIPQLGKYDPSLFPDAKSIIAIGDNKTRKNVVNETRHSFINVCHSSSVISRFASIGTGNMILHGAIIQAQARIGNHVIVNTGAQVDHDCIVEDYVHIGPGAVLCGTVTLGEGAFIGARAVIVPGKKVGAWATVGAGAVVRNDVPDHAIVAGNPAKIIKYNR
jgi:sugar O-acyltransferase (sialic acid O-acetyltransferase NeuD family)